MRPPTARHARPPIAVLGAAIACGLLEWMALLRSRWRERRAS